jgi:hypothetical protein
MEQLWQEWVEQSFEKVADAQNANLSKFMKALSDYSDDRVDSMRKQKDEELA